MSTQLAFDLTTPRTPRATAPYVSGSQPSQAAAQRVSVSLGAKQLAVLRLLVAAPRTDNELIRATVGPPYEWSQNTARARRVELRDLEFVADSGARREGSTVWTVTPAGLEWLADHLED